MYTKSGYCSPRNTTNYIDTVSLFQIYTYLYGSTRLIKFFQAQCGVLETGLGMIILIYFNRRIYFLNEEVNGEETDG